MNNNNEKREGALRRSSKNEQHTREGSVTAAMGTPANEVRLMCAGGPIIDEQQIAGGVSCLTMATLVRFLRSYGKCTISMAGVGRVDGSACISSSSLLLLPLLLTLLCWC